MSLADRLAAARRQKVSTETVDADDSSGWKVCEQAQQFGPVRRSQATGAPDAARQPRPKLYDSRLTQTELEQKVRQTLQEVLAKKTRR